MTTSNQALKRIRGRILHRIITISSWILILLGVALLRTEPVLGAENPVLRSPHLFGAFFLAQGICFGAAIVVMVARRIARRKGAR